MESTRVRYNPKRKVALSFAPSGEGAWATWPKYGGNPEHKRNPGDFGLDPPSKPRPDKMLCDAAQVFHRKKAQDLLKRGARRGMVSMQVKAPHGFPQNIWCVDDEGVVFEAQLENVELGTYHGYPMSHGDPFRAEVVVQWNLRSNTPHE